MDKRMSLFTGVTSYDDIKDVDIVVEAVFEDMAVKKQVFENSTRSASRVRSSPPIHRRWT